MLLFQPLYKITFNRNQLTMYRSMCEPIQLNFNPQEHKRFGQPQDEFCMKQNFLYVFQTGKYLQLINLNQQFLKNIVFV